MKSRNQHLSHARIQYIALQILGILIYALYEDYYGLILWAMITLLPILSLIFSYIKMIRLRINLKLEKQALLHNQEVPMTISFFGNQSLPNSYYEIRYFVRQPFSHTFLKEDCTIENDQFSILLQHCGKVDITIPSIKTYDLLSLFPLRKNFQYHYSFYIYPDIIPLSFLSTPLPEEQLINKGEDLSTIYELRNYQEGDPLKKIHWKLSSKKDTLITKVGSAYEEYGAILILRLGNSPVVNDKTLCYFHSVASKLCKHMSILVIYANSYQKEYRIQNEDAYYHFLHEILSSEISSAQPIEITYTHYYLFEDGKMSSEEGEYD